MSKMTSVHIKTVSSFSFYHNDRSKKPSYALGDSSLNECDKSAQQATAEILELYTMAQINYVAKHNKKFQAKNILAEAVIVIDEKTTLSEVQAVAKMIEDKTGYKAIQSAIHKDEIYQSKNYGFEANETKTNLHAHIVFFSLDRETGKSLQRQMFNNKIIMKDIQTETATILQMARGISKEITRAEHIPHKIYRQTIRTADKHFEQELQKWHSKLKSKAIDIFNTTTTAIKRFFLSEEFQKVEAENSKLKAINSEQSQALQNSQSRAEELSAEATHYKKELIHEKTKHINIELPKPQQDQTQERTTTRVRTL
jgi:hypothetical protein